MLYRKWKFYQNKKTLFNMKEFVRIIISLTIIEGIRNSVPLGLG